MTFQAVQDPRVSYLEQIMKDIQAGIIKVPRFQRREVWPWSAQRDLLCSIYEGLPIGAILLWQTRLPNIRARTTIGPFDVPQQDYSPNHSYILDGLQRLTTIYSIVYHPRVDLSKSGFEKLNDYTVYYDLEADEIEDKFILETQCERLGINTDNQRYFPIRFIFNSKEVMRFQRSIGDQNEKWIDEIDELVSAFKNYKIPIVPLASDDQQLATKSFERVNTRGEDMSETHMLNALSYTDKFELLERLEVNSEKYLADDPLWKDGLDDEFILMAMKLSVGKGPYFKRTDELAKLIDQKQVEKVFRAIKAMIDFSISNLFIESPNAFPYKLQMLGITYAFMSRRSLSIEQLKAWCNLTSYYGVFGLTGRVSENALNDFIHFVDSGRYEWSSNLPTKLLPIPEEVNYRSSRTKALLFAMAEKMDDQPDSFYHKHVAKKKGRSVIVADEFKELNKRLGYLFMTNEKSFSLANLPNSDLDKHFLNEDLWALFKERKFNEFALKREELIFEWEKSNFVEPSKMLLNIEVKS